MTDTSIVLFTVDIRWSGAQSSLTIREKSHERSASTPSSGSSSGSTSTSCGSRDATAGADSAVERRATLRDWSHRIAKNSRASSDTRRSW